MRSVPDGRVQRLTVMLRSGDHSHHHLLATEMLARARRAHLAGATLLQAVEGRGRSGAVHHSHLFGHDAPLSLVVVDDADKIGEFVAANHDLLEDVVVVVDDVTAFRA
ncbi:MAG: DUF190 domain-containing protein [Actinomycetota bacterium]|nr:DUF190 domain-containing protein [Actinomycetota bacterium]